MKTELKKNKETELKELTDEELQQVNGGVMKSTCQDGSKFCPEEIERIIKPIEKK